MSVLRLDLIKPTKDFGVAIGAFVNFCRAKNLSPTTIASYFKRLKMFAKFVEARGETPATFTRSIVVSFVEHLLRTHTAPTVNGYIRTLNVFCSFLVAEGYRQDNPVRGIPKVKEPQHYPHTLTDEQLIALLKQPNPQTFVVLRDLIVLLLMCDAGLRVSEVCNLTINDVDLAQGFSFWSNKEKVARTKLFPLAKLP